MPMSHPSPLCPVAKGVRKGTFAPSDIALAILCHCFLFSLQGCCDGFALWAHLSGLLLGKWSESLLGQLHWTPVLQPLTYGVNRKGGSFESCLSCSLGHKRVAVAGTVRGSVCSRNLLSKPSDVASSRQTAFSNFLTDCTFCKALSRLTNTHGFPFYSHSRVEQQSST